MCSRGADVTVKQFSRRAFGRLWAGSALYAGAQRTGLGAVEGRLELEGQPRADLSLNRRYRADAQVIILSVPLLHRTSVGGGNVQWSEWAVANGGSQRLIEFLGFSAPERAAGLNRLGFIRELTRTAPGGNRDAIYFGLMTASNEESAEEGRKALHSKATESAYTVIEGRIAGDASTSALAHFMGPSRISVARRGELVTMGRRALSGVPVQPAGFTMAQSPPPFLNALADALLGRPQVESRYVYAGRLYRLQLQKTADPKATEYFQKRKLIAPGAKVVRASGTVRRDAGGIATQFGIWVEEGNPRPIPLRIEYQAKSYLRLTFEAES
jgi:hypothetical protein